MSAMNDFADLVRSLSPAMATLLLRGAVETLDSYARPRVIIGGTAGIGLTWRRGKKGYYLGQEKGLTANGGVITIVDSGAAPELQIQSGIIFFSVDSLDARGITEPNAYVMAKYDGGGTAFRLYVNAALDQSLTLYNGTAASVLTYVGMNGARTVAVRITAGDKPKLFTDGVYRVDGNANFTPTVNDADLTLTNAGGLLNGSRRNNYGFLAIFPVLTDQEIAELHDAWERIGSVFTPRRTIWLPRKATEVVATAPLVHLAGERNANSLLLDLSGNGRNRTISGRVTQTRSACCSRQRAHGAGNPLMAAAADTSLYPNSFTLELRYMARSRGESNQGCLWSISDSGTTRTRLYLGAANTWYYEVAYAGATARWTFSAGPYNIDHVLVLKHARSAGSAPTVELDGEALTVTQAVAPSGALTACAAPIVNLLNTAALDSDFDGDLIGEKQYASALDDAGSRALYLDHALRCNVLSHQTDQPISVAAVAAGGNAGPWRVLSGTHKWDNYAATPTNPGRRRMLGVTAGYFASRDSSPQAYGAWYGRLLKGTDGGVAYMLLLWSAPKAAGVSGANGYVVAFNSTERVVLYRYDGAGGVGWTVFTVEGAIAINTEYELFVTRRPRDGYFVVWIRGGAYATWTSLLTGIDNVHTTSNCLVGYLDAGGTLADMQLFPNGGTLLPTEVPWLAAA